MPIKPRVMLLSTDSPKIMLKKAQKALEEAGQHRQSEDLAGYFETSVDMYAKNTKNFNNEGVAQLQAMDMIARFCEITGA